MQKVIIVLTIICFLFSANTASANPIGLAMKVVGGIKMLASLGEMDKKNDVETANVDALEYSKKITAERQAQKGNYLMYGEKTDKIQLNQRAVTFFFNALRNSKQTIVFITYYEIDADLVGWQAVIFDDLEEYSTFLKKYNGSKKQMVSGILLSEFKIDIGPVENATTTTADASTTP